MKHKILIAYYNRHGYEIEMNGKIIYSAGTNPNDSQDHSVSTIKQVLKLAKITAGDFAEHYKLKHNQIAFEYKDENEEESD